MLNEFDKQLFFDNISYLLKRKGMRIGELESLAGVSTGYISRTTKDAGTKPGIDFVVNAANALNVSLDALLHVDFSARSTTEEYLSAFIDKLTEDTMNEQLYWKAEKANYLNSLRLDDMRQRPNYLFKIYRVDAVIDDDAFDPRNKCITRFESHTFSSETKIAGDCYNLNLDEKTRLYIMNVKPSDKNSMDYFMTDTPLEMWIVEMATGKKQFLVSDDPKTDKERYISAQLRRLYTSVEEYMKMPQVNRCFRDAIDTFMNSGNDSSGNSFDSLPIE